MVTQIMHVKIKTVLCFYCSFHNGVITSFTSRGRLCNDDQNQISNSALYCIPLITWIASQLCQQMVEKVNENHKGDFTQNKHLNDEKDQQQKTSNSMSLEKLESRSDEISLVLYRALSSAPTLVANGTAPLFPPFCMS